MTQLIEQFRAARRVSVPLVSVATPDQAATVKTLLEACTNGTEPPALQWDIVRGIQPLNEPGQAAAKTINATPITTGNPVEALSKAAGLPTKSLLFMHNAHRIVDNQGVAQGLNNLRDLYKRDTRTCVLLSPSLTLPVQLVNDVLSLDEALPTRDMLQTVVTKLYAFAQLGEPPADLLERATDALVGLPIYAAEQAAALALRREGLEIPDLWERKRRLVEGVPGLSVWRGKETFDDLAGCANIKQFLLRLLEGKRKPRAILFLDEVEKMVAGSGDTSGTSQAMQEAFLAWTQDTKAIGIILLGVPGAGKSATAKAAAGTGEIPCLQLSLSGVKGSLVGESERNIRVALKTVDAIAQGSVLMIATCNSIDALTPELRGRFRLGTFFYDYPDDEENAALWTLYTERYNLCWDPVQDRPASKHWVGREIESCCEIADRLGISLEESARYIVPVSTGSAERMERLRRDASGCYISAAYDGPYRFPEAGEQLPERAFAAFS